MLLSKSFLYRVLATVWFSPSSLLQAVINHKVGFGKELECMPDILERVLLKKLGMISLGLEVMDLALMESSDSLVDGVRAHFGVQIFVGVDEPAEPGLGFFERVAVCHGGCHCCCQ